MDAGVVAGIVSAVLGVPSAVYAALSFHRRNQQPPLSARSASLTGEGSALPRELSAAEAPGDAVASTSLGDRSRVAGSSGSPRRHPVRIDAGDEPGVAADSDSGKGRAGMDGMALPSDASGGVYDDALRDLSRALELCPDDAWILARRGETYRLAVSQKAEIRSRTGSVDG